MTLGSNARIEGLRWSAAPFRGLPHACTPVHSDRGTRIMAAHLIPSLSMAAKRAKKKAAGKKTTAKKKTSAKTKASAKTPPKPPMAIVAKPKKPARANKAATTPRERTIFVREEKPPPKPKATISRAKALTLANTFLKDNVGKAALHAPRASRFRLGSIVDRDGIINVLFCHEADDFDPVITSLGAKCLDALVAAHPQLRAFEIQVQTIRM